MPGEIINFKNEHIVIKDETDLLNAIGTYFSFINDNNEIPTFTGLALTLGISRTKLRSLPPESPYTPIIERAKQYIVDYAEKQLFLPKSATGVQFWLKNNDDWTDKQDITITKPKTMVDILNELQSKGEELPLLEANPSNPNLPDLFSNQHDATHKPPSAPRQDVEVVKPLSDYQQAW